MRVSSCRFRGVRGHSRHLSLVIRQLDHLNVTVHLNERIDLKSVAERKTNDKGERVVLTESGKELAADLIVRCLSAYLLYQPNQSSISSCAPAKSPTPKSSPHLTLLSSPPTAARALPGPCSLAHPPPCGRTPPPLLNRSWTLYSSTPPRLSPPRPPTRGSSPPAIARTPSTRSAQVTMRTTRGSWRREMC